MHHNSIKHILGILFLLGILIQILSGIWIFNLYQKVFEDNNKLIENYRTIRIANRSLLSIDEASINLSIFLLTNNTEYIKNLPKIIYSIQLDINTLSSLISDNPIQANIMQGVQQEINKKISFLNNVVALALAGKQTDAVNLANNEDRLIQTNKIHQIMQLIKQFENEQLKQEKPLIQQLKYNADQAFILLGVLNILWFFCIYICLQRYFTYKY